MVHKIEQIIRFCGDDEFRMEQRLLGPALFLPRTVLDEYIDEPYLHDFLRLESDYHLSRSFRIHHPVGQEAIRSKRERRAALSRDGYACIITLTAYPTMTYVFPGFMLVGRRGFETTRSMMGAQFFIKYIGELDNEFGSCGNIFALNKELAAWRRMGAWALESIQEPQKTDKASGWENALKFQWLPDCSKKLELGESVESIDATIDRVIETLRVAQSNGLPPRSPEEGGDLIEQHLTDGELLRSGHIFRVQHETEEEADFFRDTINMHWVYSRVSMISC